MRDDVIHQKIGPTDIGKPWSFEFACQKKGTGEFTANRGKVTCPECINFMEAAEDYFSEVKKK